MKLFTRYIISTLNISLDGYNGCRKDRLLSYEFKLDQYNLVLADFTKPSLDVPLASKLSFLCASLFDSFNGVSSTAELSPS